MPDAIVLRPEYDAFSAALTRVLLDAHGLRGRHRPVIGVAGESGSGKSVTATALARDLTAAGLPTGVLHQDDYFVRPPRTNHDARVTDIAAVGPHEVNLARLAAHVAAFRRGEDGVECPRVNYPADRFDACTMDFGPLAALVVEGTYVLTLDALDVRVFLEATHADTRARRQRRARDADDPFVERVLAIEHALIAPQAARADLLVARDFTIRAGRA
jgi:uridine kinase